MVLALVACLGAAAEGAQETPGPAVEPAVEEAATLSLRVLAVLASGEVQIDRGARDGVEVGSAVRLLPKDGAPRHGVVTSVEERTAQVELDAGSTAVAPGVRGEVEVALPEAAPAEGATADSAPEQTSDGPGDQLAEEGAPPERPRPAWERTDDGWTASEPLLARVHAERPEERTRVIGGRLYFAGGFATTLDGERGHGASRGGFDALVTNPFGRGGQLDLDAEIDVRSDFVPADDGSDRGAARLRFDALSYSWGGDRYSPEGYTVGRFLMRTTPELGRVDGIEWTQRLDGGDRFGANAGYLVEDDFDASTGHDLGFTAFYRWVPDERELVAVTGAFEKTFHNGDRDRDLFFVRATALPGGGLGPWQLHAAVWYDLYDDSDTLEEGGAEISRSIVQAWHDWESAVRGRRDHIGLSLVHEGFAETKALELDPLFAAGLAAERVDRFAVDGDLWIDPERRLFYTAGLWDDADEAGFDVESGVALEGGRFGTRSSWLDAGEHFDVRSFASVGRTSTVLGAGCAFGKGFEQQDELGWEVAYEVLHEDFDGFEAGSDDAWQHRLRYTLDLAGLGNWRLAGHAEALLQGGDLGVASGFALTRHF